MPGPMRILHAPLNIANDDWSVREAESMLGCESELAIIATPTFGTRFDTDLRFTGAGPLERQIRKSAATLRLLHDHDVVHYSFGRSIVDYVRPFDLLDMRLARHLGKVVAMTFHGSDVRPLLSGGCGAYPMSSSAQAAAHRLKIIERNADLIYVKTPDLLPAVPKASYVPQAVSGVSALEPVLYAGDFKEFTIVHAPSNRCLKGTDSIISAVQAVRARGYRIKLILVEHMRHEDALRVYRQADLAIDQMLIGWYGVFAVEAMALGKPVICYIDTDVLARSGVQGLPVVNATPDSLPDVIENLVADRASLSSIGAAGHRFVATWHDPVRIAKRLISDYAQIVAGQGRAYA